MTALNVSARGNYTRGVDRILNMPRAGVYRAAALTMVDTVSNVISWDTVDYDVEGMWKSTLPTRLTVVTAGLYDFNACCSVTNGGAIAGFRQIYLRKNGAIVYAPVEVPPPGTVDWAASTGWHVPMNAGDYMEVVVTQLSGFSLAFQAASSTGHLNGFQACLIST